MRFLSTLFHLSLFATGTLAAKKSSREAANRFTKWHTQALSSTPIEISDDRFGDLTQVPRDYSVAILFTAMDPKFQCMLCREYDPEWKLLAKSWTKGDKAGDSRLVFGTLDFNTGRNTFMAHGLQTAPVLLFYRPTTGPHAVVGSEPLQYDFSANSATAESVHAWLARHLPDRPHPRVTRPINWSGWITSLVMILGGLTAVAVAWSYILPIIQNRNLWAAGSLITILLFTSGHMFNQIRHVPYVVNNGKGGIDYFASGLQNQFGLETQIIAGIYGLLSLCAIALVVKVPRIPDLKVQSACVLGWGSAMLVTYSFLMSVFRIKNGGYPYSLPPFM